MIRPLYTLILPILFFVVGHEATAQSVCVDYHKFNCQPAADKRWSVNGQSKSASVQIGRETELNIIIYRGQDYRISVCQDAKLLGENVAIRLVEKVRVPRDGGAALAITDDDGNQTGTTKSVSDPDRMFEEIEKVLWDNTDHDMVQEVEFSCATTKRIAIKIIAAGPTNKPKGKDKQFDIGCAGILVEHMVTPDLGF